MFISSQKLLLLVLLLLFCFTHHLKAYMPVASVKLEVLTPS